MPRYFFNLRHGSDPRDLAIDPDGDELSDIEAARARALDSARDLIARTQLDCIHDWFACSFEIIDEAARPLMIVPFSDTIQGRDEAD